jgi:hypothetical protein
MNDTPKDIIRKQFDIIYSKPLYERVKSVFEMTELSRTIIRNQIKEKNPGISEVDLKIELFKTFYRSDFDNETLKLITDNMRATLMKK